MRNKALRGFIILVSTLALSTAADAQLNRRNWTSDRHKRLREFVQPNTWALGMTIGTTDLWGDVGTKGISDHYNNSNYGSNIKFMGGMYGRYTAHPSLGIRLGINFGTLYASDEFNEKKAKAAASVEDDYYQRYLRNQKIKNVMWDGHLVFEFNPLRMNIDNDKARNRRFQPYVMAGIGGYYMTPKAEYKNRQSGEVKWLNIYDLHLEGDGFGKLADGSGNLYDAPKRYKRYGLSVPLGFGVRWDIGQQLGLGLEYMYRYTFSDYLDGVSDRYVNPLVFDQNLSVKDAAIAKDIYDRSWIINPYVQHSPGELRGNKAVPDGYSTISVNFYYKVRSKRIPWWYQR